MHPLTRSSGILPPGGSTAVPAGAACCPADPAKVHYLLAYRCDLLVSETWLFRKTSTCDGVTARPRHIAPRFSSTAGTVLNRIARSFQNVQVRAYAVSSCTRRS